MVQPFSAAISRHCSTSAASGICSAGPQAQKSMPSLAHTTMSELPTLLPASPMNVSLLPASLPVCSRTVSMSAIICVGWNSVVRPFHTGTPALAARSSTML